MENNLPAKLEVGRELKKRGVILEGIEQLEKGAQGEQWVLDTFSEFAPKHWKILQNIWLDYQGAFECDLLVVNAAGMYPIEIKNYSGQFSYKNNTCLLNGKKVGYNPIYQAQKVKLNLENIMQKQFPRINVQGTLLFVGEHHTIEIADQIPELQVLMRNQLRNLIWTMEVSERNLQGPGLDITACLQWLEQFKTENPFQAEPIDSRTKEQLRRGICCSNCGSFEVDTRKTYITCSCGMHEPKENAIVRTICEYGVIHFDQQLKTSELFKFFNGQVSRSTLLSILNKHFAKIGTPRTRQYKNLCRPFELVYASFRFKKERILYLKNY